MWLADTENENLSHVAEEWCISSNDACQRVGIFDTEHFAGILKEKRIVSDISCFNA